jgi:hypothetical protein
MKKLLLIVAVLLGATAANATTDIRFKKGDSCWSFVGKDDHFVGKFRSWQDITVKAFFETEEGLIQHPKVGTLLLKFMFKLIDPTRTFISTSAQSMKRWSE